MATAGSSRHWARASARASTMVRSREFNVAGTFNVATAICPGPALGQSSKSMPGASVMGVSLQKLSVRDGNQGLAVVQLRLHGQRAHVMQ